MTFDKCGGVDFHNSTAEGGLHGATMSGEGSVNGTYDQEVFTQRAVNIIRSHNKSEPLYLYVAYHNVHDACQHDRFALGLDAPKGTVDVRIACIILFSILGWSAEPVAYCEMGSCMPLCFVCQLLLGPK